MKRVHVQVDGCGDVYCAWLSGYARSTQETHATCIMDCCRTMDISVAALVRDGVDLEEYRRRSEQWPLAERTIQTRISAVRSFLRFAERYRREHEGGEAA